MENYALILNSGSSSLKFCAYRKPDQTWQMASRGQIDVIGTSPRLSVTDGEGRSLADQKLERSIRDGRDALSALAAWLRSQYGGVQLAGVGHRVVHGGARFASPVVVTRKILDELYELVPFVPLH